MFQRANLLLPFVFFTILFSSAVDAQELNNKAQDTARLERVLTQKLRLLDKILHSPDMLDKVQRSNSHEAQLLLEQSIEQASLAKISFEQGELEVAKQSVDVSLKMLSSVTMITRKIQQEADKDKLEFHELLNSIESVYNITNLKMSGHISEQIQQAKLLAGDEDYQKANQLLNQAYSETSQLIIQAFDKKTITYALDFTSKKDEYFYEVKRYQSTHELINHISSKRPGKKNDPMLKGHLLKALNKFAQAQSAAKQENYQQAIYLMEETANYLQMALRILGVAV